jgi:hypothetical protein
MINFLNKVVFLSKLFVTLSLFSNVGQTHKKSSNISTIPETSAVFSQTSPSKSITTAIDNRKKRQRRVYQQRESPYATRQRTEAKKSE